MLDFSTNNKLILLTDANRLYQYLCGQLQKKEKIALDMEGIEYSISSFFNSSLGVLYKDFDNVEEYVDVINADEDDRFIIRKVMERAKAYYGNPQNFKDIGEV
jgi:hypothetical protein